jgi:hypothetical protein
MLTMQQLAASRMASNILIYRGITLPTDVTEYRTATEYISAKFIPRRDSSSAVDMTSGHLDPSDQIARGTLALCAAVPPRGDVRDWI